MLYDQKVDEGARWRLAIQIAAQLPEEHGDQLAVLDMTRRLMNFIARRGDEIGLDAYGDLAILGPWGARPRTRREPTARRIAGLLLYAGAGVCLFLADGQGMIRAMAALWHF